MVLHLHAIFFLQSGWRDDTALPPPLPLSLPPSFSPLPPSASHRTVLSPGILRVNMEERRRNNLPGGMHGSSHSSSSLSSSTGVLERPSALPPFLPHASP